MTTEEVFDRLAPLGEITSRAMFGGVGLYHDGTIFGIIFTDQLYLKVDDKSRGNYIVRGMEPLRPNQRQTVKSYFEVPPDVLTDNKELLFWVMDAIRAGQQG